VEDAIVKTVAAFLNTDGGTLLIGIGHGGSVVGLAHDYECVKPKNGDGFVNWLTTHLIHALGHVSVTRTRARIAAHGGAEICRVDVAASPTPVWAKTTKDEQAFFVRMNNSTRALPEPRDRRLPGRALAGAMTTRCACAKWLNICAEDF
jgi:type I restriction enzyme, R subunit